MSTFKLFISHSSGLGDASNNSDPERNPNLKLLLEVIRDIKTEYGDAIEILIDKGEKGLPAGHDWEKRLNEWLAECNAAVILFSKSAIENPDWVKKEATILSWRRELDKNFCLIPVLLQGQTDPDDLEKDLFGTLRISKNQCIRNVSTSQEILIGIKNALGGKEALQAKNRQTPFDQLQKAVENLLLEMSDQSSLMAIRELLDLDIPTWNPNNLNQLPQDLARYLLHNNGHAFAKFEQVLNSISPKKINQAALTELKKTITRLTPPARQQLVTRKNVRLPDIDWVEIPDRIFVFEVVPSKVPNPFFISRYPITYCQFQTFIDAGGYADQRWWRDLIRPDPEPAAWSQPNRPRDSVNWYEAVAFCRWLSIQQGYEIKLPSDAQWKIAAYGPEQFEFPWGQDDLINNANIALDESTGLNQTCAVGLFPQGASPYGVMDMAGNLWEWCDDIYPQTPPADPAQPARALRGGSWDSPLSDAHITAYRGQHPEWGTQDVGFRVVCQSPK